MSTMLFAVFSYYLIMTVHSIVILSISFLTFVMYAFFLFYFLNFYYGFLHFIKVFKKKISASLIFSVVSLFLSSIYFYTLLCLFFYLVQAYLDLFFFSSFFKVVTQVIHLKYFLIFSISTQCYKFLSQLCFNGVSHILIHRGSFISFFFPILNTIFLCIRWCCNFSFHFKHDLQNS